MGSVPPTYFLNHYYLQMNSVVFELCSKSWMTWFRLKKELPRQGDIHLALLVLKRDGGVVIHGR